MPDVIVFDLYGVIARTQTPEAVKRIEEIAGTPGPAFWDAYWACRPAYDAGQESASYWADVADLLGATFPDVPALTEADLESWTDVDEEMVVALAAVAAAIGDSWRGGPGLFNGLGGYLAGWAVWSGITYLVGTRLFGGRATWGELLRTLGFAQAPGVLLVLAIVPILGGLVKGVVGLWLLATGFVALRQALDVSAGRALLTALVGWVALVVVRLLIGATLGVPLY